MNRFLWCVLLLIVGCGTVSQPTPVPIPLAASPRSVIVDTDMSVDDILALLYLLSRPDVNIKAITITGTGITRCDAGIRNARAILEVLERTTIPVACGRETPLQGNRSFPREWRDAAENFFGVNLRPLQFVTPNETAVALLTRTLAASDKEITIVTLGPMTNLADAFLQNSALAAKIERVYSMGGAVNVSGNVDAAPDAEWNFYIDPLAAQQVFATKVPITLVSLDATNQIILTREFLTRFMNYKQTPAAKLAERLLQAQRGEIERGAYYVWDLVGAVILTDETLGEMQEMNIAIENETGRSKPDPQGKPVRAVMNMDAPRFEATFLQTLNGQFR